MPGLFLGIDVGTTGSKALLIDEDGVVQGESTTEYPMHTPKPLWSEQDPEAWWEATATSIRTARQKAGPEAGGVAAIGLTGQMHGLVLLDSRGTVLRPCIMWNDQRTAAECAEITAAIGSTRILELTGNSVLPGFTAPKILWVRKHEPEVYGHIARILLPKDYIRYRLSGTFGTDVSDASGMSLFDVGRRRWSGDMLHALSIPEAWLPPCAESCEVTAAVNAEAARVTGLPQGTPIVAGAGDQAAQAVGTGVVDEGIVSVTIGTSGVVFATSNAYRIEPAGRLHAFCHAVPGLWHLMGVMLSAGGSFRWYRDTFCEQEKKEAAAAGIDPYEILTREASMVSAGSEGLLFLPYLTGERTPYPDPTARGVFFGLTVRHTKAHLTRAVMEGVSFGLRDSLELMRSLGVPSREVRVSGGGAQSTVWRQMMADIFATDIVTVNAVQGAAFGAALLASVGVGAFPSVPAAARSVVRATGTAHPAGAQAVYERLYPRYQALYPALAKEFAALAAT